MVEVTIMVIIFDGDDNNHDDSGACGGSKKNMKMPLIISKTKPIGLIDLSFILT